MATMPLLSVHGQAERASAWFDSASGQAVLDSERATIAQVLSERPGLPWFWLAPTAAAPLEAADGRDDVVAADGFAAGADFSAAPQRGLALGTLGDGWSGAVRCRLPLPLASESIGTVVLQHVVRTDAHGLALLDECARVLVPGGRLLLFALNPLSAYRWRWRGSGMGASEPLTWRRRLRAVGLLAEPVSQGIGPAWRPEVTSRLQNGPGLRVAYVLRAEKRTWPLTPVRRAVPLRIAVGAPAA